MSNDDDIRGILAAEVEGDVPEKFWPYSDDDDNPPILYERSINAVAGPLGVGKSTITTRIVADVSRHGPVLYGNAEDDRFMQSIKLQAAGADMASVRLASYSIPSDLDALYTDISRLGAVLTVFDTAEKHIEGGVQKWGRALMALWEVLQETESAALFVHHTLKSVKETADWRAALGGATSGLGGSARQVALVGLHTEPGADTSSLVFCPVKDQYGEVPKALAFGFQTEDHITQSGKTVQIPYVEIAKTGVEISNPTALVAVSKSAIGKRGPAAELKEEAVAFLSDLLSEGPVPVSNVYRCKTKPDSTGKPDDPSRKCGHVSLKSALEAGGDDKNPVCPDCGGEVELVLGIRHHTEEEGLKWPTIKRAKKELEIDTKKKGAALRLFNYWVLPEGHPKVTNDTRLLP